MTTECTLRIARENDLPELLTLWTAVLNGDESVFTSEYDSCPPDKRICFVAEADGKIVSSVQVFILPVRDENLKPIEIGAIANVSTLPEYRLQGLSTGLLLQAIKKMGAMHCAWSFLFTGITPFYERLGWRIIHRSYPKVDLVGVSLPESNGVERQKPADLIALRALIERCPPTPLSQIRGDLDWELKIPPRMENLGLLVGDECYAIVSTRRGETRIGEWGMTEPSIERYHNLLVEAARFAQANGAGSLTIAAPIHPEARQALEALFMQIDDVDDLDAMVRPIADDWPMSRLVSLFAQPDARFLRLDNF